MLNFRVLSHWSMSQLMRLWYLSHRRPAKAQASLRNRVIFYMFDGRSMVQIKNSLKTYCSGLWKGSTYPCLEDIKGRRWDDLGWQAVPESDAGWVEWILEGVDTAKGSKESVGMTSSMGTSWNEQRCSLDVNKMIDDPVEHGSFQLLASCFELFPIQVFNHGWHAAWTLV